MMSYKKYSFVLSASITILVLSSCEKIEWFSPKHENEKGIIIIDSFSTLKTHGLFNICLVEDTIDYIEYSCGANQVEKLAVSSTNDTLELFNNNGFSFFYGYEKIDVDVHYRNIGLLEIFSPCKVYSTDTIHNNFCIAIRSEIAEIDLTFDNSGVCFYNYPTTGGIYTFKGKTKSLYFLGYYTAQFNMADLECTEAHVENHSVYDQVVFVTNKLNASTYFSGNIIYKGNPEVIVDTIARTGRIYPFTLN
jgi:hypothetical protein